MRRALALTLLVLSFGSAGFVYALTPLPPPTGYVNDFAHVMSPELVEGLEAELVAFNASTTNEVAVVTISSLAGDYIEHYAVEVFEQWGIGTESSDNGVLLLLAIDDRELRIEVGYGLEGALPDSVAASIIDDMTPLLKDGNYDGAITLGVHSIMLATEGEYVGTGSTSSGVDGEAILTIIFFAFTVLAWLVAILARTKSVWAGGVVGAAVGVGVSSIFGWWLVAGLLATGVFVGLGLLFDWAVSSAYTEAKRGGTTPPWWTGGAGGFGGSSSSSSWGGFGGGSSGGGGASGSW